MQLPFSALLQYLIGLGMRRTAIGRACLGFEGKGVYPVVVVEPDPLVSETQAGLLTYDLAFLVLDREQVEGKYRADSTQWPEVLSRTGQWADELIEQLRGECPGDLVKGSVSRAALTEYGKDLALGWRVELRLQVRQSIDRNANDALFTPPVGEFPYDLPHELE